MATRVDGGNKYVGIHKRGNKWSMRVRLGSKDVHETFSSEESAPPSPVNDCDCVDVVISANEVAVIPAKTTANNVFLNIFFPW